MAHSKADVKASYPLPVYRYRVSIDGDWYAFSEVSGLSISYEPITYKQGLSWVEGAEQIPGMRGEVRINLKRGIVPARSSLLEWFHKIQNREWEKRDLLVELCDENEKTVASWKVRNTIPIKMEAPGFDLNSNEVAIESMELIGNDLEIKY